MLLTTPNKEWVYDAFRYAASKDVLLVHAAGNDGKNIDKSDNFPTDADDKVKEYVDNVITVGAMTRQYDENLVATFSNYGKLNVDIFAPGLEIYSTIPNNEYKSSKLVLMLFFQKAMVKRFRLVIFPFPEEF